MLPEIRFKKEFLEQIENELVRTETPTIDDVLDAIEKLRYDNCAAFIEGRRKIRSDTIDQCLSLKNHLDKTSDEWQKLLYLIFLENEVREKKLEQEIYG